MSNFEPGAYIGNIAELVQCLEVDEWIFWSDELTSVDEVWACSLEHLRNECANNQFQYANDPDDHF